jgi:hypothetical protein
MGVRVGMLPLNEDVSSNGFCVNLPLYARRHN